LDNPIIKDQRVDSFKKSKKFFFDVGFYLLISIAVGAVPFLITPFITRILDVSEFGAFSLFQSVVLFLVPLIGFTSQYFVQKSIVRCVGKEDRSVLLNNILLFCSLNVLILVIGIFVVSHFICYTKISTIIMCAIPLGALSQALVQVLSVVSRYDGNKLLFALSQLSPNFIMYSVGITLLITVFPSWESFVIGMVIAALMVIWIYLSTIGFNSVRIKDIKKTVIFEVFRFGLPLMPHSFSGFFLTIFDRWILGILIDAKSVGLFSVTYMFGAGLQTILDSIIRVWEPMLFRLFADAEKNKNREANRKSALIFIAFGVIAIVLSLFSYLIFPWLFPSSEYAEIRKYVAFSMCSGLFYSSYKSLVPYFVFFNKLKAIGKITGYMNLFKIIISYFLIIKFGFLGIYLANVLSFGVLFIGALVLLNRCGLLLINNLTRVNDSK